MEIVRKKLSADELDPHNQRYNTGTDTVQTFIGDTWVDTPSADPRISSGLLFPPRTGGDPQCDAAANMTAKVKSIVDYYVATAEQALFVSGVLTLISVFIPLVGLIAEALWALADILVGLGVVAVTGAMTDEVYDALTCIFYCNMDTNGQVSSAQLDDIETQVIDQFDATAETVINSVLGGLGWVGLSNAGATGEETGDCDACTACDETCHLYDPMVVDMDYTNDNDGVTLFGTYDTGDFEDDKALVLNNVHAEWTALDGTGAIVAQGIHVTVYSLDVYPAGHVFTVNDLSGVVSLDVDTTGSGHVYRIGVQIFTQWSGGGAYSIWDVLRFDYDPVHAPFGWSRGVNCTP